MGAAKKLLDKKVLKELVPLNALSAVHLDEISRKAIIETVRSGRYVFKAGDRDYQSVYLLEGKVELVDAHREVVGTLVGGSEAASHPLAHKQPRQVSVRATGSVTVVRVDSGLLDVLLTWDESSGYDVVEIGAEDGGDWMTRMLQSQAFMQLPPSNIHQLLMRLEPVNIRAGDVVVKQGDDGDYFYIVKAGRMAVSRKASARGKDVLLAELGEGACFGEEALVSGARRNATVTMLTDGSLMRLSKEDFSELLCAPLVHEVDYAQASQLVDEGASWLDVRLPGEFSNQYIKGSRNLPLSALREQADTLDRDGRYIVCCDTGRRSASGAFILGQRGLDVYTLINGLMDVPGEALSGDAESSPGDVPAHDADILPFDNEGAADDDGAATSQLNEQLRASETARDEQQSELEKMRQQVESLESALQDSKSQHNALLDQLEETKQLGDTAAEAGEDIEKQRAQLESELARVRDDYQQLGQRTSAVAGERDAASRELEKARAELEDLKARVDSQQGEISEQVSTLQKQLDERTGELAEAERVAAEASDRESALATQLSQLEQQASEQQKQLQENFLADKSALEEQLQSLQDSHADDEQKLAEQSGERDALAGKLADVEQQLLQSQAAEQSVGESLEQTRQQAEDDVQRIRTELQKEQDALLAEIETLREAVAGQDQLVAQLQERDRALADAGRDRDLAQQQLEEQVREREALNAQLGENTEREDQLTQRVAELEQQLTSRESEYESDLGSARQAMSRAQTEVDNLKREQQRLLNRNRKAEETLDRERHDHEVEVHRLHKEMKSAAEGSSEALAAELEALQGQVSEAARLRDDLEIRLGERSAQLEDTQARAEQLDQQLKLAQQSAQEAEQQLVEATRMANEEMEIRLNTEQGIQQGLREALEESGKACNSHQETITVIKQELEDLREAYQQSKQAQESHENAAGRLDEVQARLDSVQAERDALLSSTDSLKNELDQLRAEAEVHRGLEGMLSGEGGDSTDSEALQQARQNVEMAVRLRTQAEAQVEALKQEMEQLREQLRYATETPAPATVEGMIPSLDDNDPHASNPMLPDVPAYEEVDDPESGVLLDDEIANIPEQVQIAAPKSGLIKGLLVGLAVGVMAGAGVFWWQADTASRGLASKPVQQHLSDTPRVARAPAKRMSEHKPAVQSQPAVVMATRASDHGSDKPEAVGAKSGVVTLSERSRAFPLAKGMPDIPRGADVSTTGSEDKPVSPVAEKTSIPAVQEADADAGISGPAVEPVPEPREPAVEQPAGSFRDRLGNNGSGPAMVRFRADHFLMGSSEVSQQFDERPQHTVQLAGFAIAAHEITFDEYDAFARATGRRRPADQGWGRGARPVINVSWEDASAYARWLSAQTGAHYRLPIEAEWEFVARSGTRTRYWWGEDLIKNRANCFDCGSTDSGVQTSRVGSFPANAWGVYDMTGNVREWVQDCYVPNYSRAPDDGRAVDVGGCVDRVVRGGAYSSPSDQLRSASRDRVEAQVRLDNLGFRVVREY